MAIFMQPSDPITILKKLVAIPSYVDAGHDESKAAKFVFDYLSQFPYLHVERQKVSGRRFNIIAQTKKNTGKKILFAGHLDTVQPKVGWQADQFSLMKKGDFLYGLGSLDMKGSIAAMLGALASLKDPKNLAFLFYCDEEYDFAGMKTFLQRRGDKKSYQLAILGEPSDLKIMNVHRGLIEISFSTVGKTGHAANPHGGINAIDATYTMLADLRRWMKSFRHPKLGPPSLNVAYIRGGLQLSENSTAIGKQGNNIADFCEVVVDIRTTSPLLRAKQVVHRLARDAKLQGVTLRNVIVRHDLGSLHTSKQNLLSIEKIVTQHTGEENPYLDPVGRGYSDGQMLQEKFNIPVVSIGPRGKGVHAIREAVEKKSLYTCRDVYASIMGSAER